jgi:hypothetical protein
MGSSRFRPVISGLYGTLLLITLSGAIGSGSASANPAKPRSVVSPQLPLLFEQNQGQFDASVDYVARGKGYSIVLGQQAVIEMYRFRTESFPGLADFDEKPRIRTEIEEAAKIRLRIKGAREDAVAIPLEKQQALTHYLTGEASDWRTDVPNFRRVRYGSVLPDIDIEYYGRNGRLEYDFVVHPGGDPASISLDFDGAQGISINEQGDLVIDLGEQQIVQRAPVSYQLAENGERTAIVSSYTLSGDNVGFQVAAWDAAKTLVIDPVLEYSRYYGGAGYDHPFAVDLDAAGNIYVIGTSSSTELATTGAFQEANAPQRGEIVQVVDCNDCSDGPGPQVERHHITSFDTSILITKFSPDGATVLYTTYLSPADKSQFVGPGINSAAVSDSGEVAFGLEYNVGAGWPLLNATHSWSESQINVYLAKLNSAGSALVFGTYLNIGDGWALRGLDVSPTGEVAVTGGLGIGNSFPEVNSIPGQSCTLSTDPIDYIEGFVILFDTTGGVSFASCLGGDITDGPLVEALRGVTIASNGDIYTVGYSAMTDFPVVNPIQATINVAGARVMTISQIDPDTGSLVFSTYFGPSSAEVAPDERSGFLQFWPIDIKTDSGGNIIVTGVINSLSYPTVNAFQTNLGVPQNTVQFRPGQQASGASDVYVTKLHPDNGVIFSTYLGGSQAEAGFPVLAIDENDNIYVAVVTHSDDYPVMNPIQSSISGDSSLVLSKFTPGGALAFSTYLGGSNDQASRPPGGIAVNANGKIIAAGVTWSDDFPVVNSGTSRSGSGDITLSIIDQSGDTDGDGDGVPDAVDAFAGDGSEWRDTDGDLTGDNADLDDDEDGEPDISDRFPKDSSEISDADEDGAGDNLDQFDADPLNYFDLDDDGIGDFADTDADGDGVEAPLDAFDFDDTETTDTDGDGVGDEADEDDDGDGLLDFNDTDPLESDGPVLTFEDYTAWDVINFKSPWPEDFTDVPGADLAWTSAEDQAYRGNRSFSSHQEIDHGQVAAIQVSDILPGGILQFRYKVDSQENYDLFTFSVDSSVVLTDSGDSGWQLFSMPILPGAHTLEWRYAKDGSISAGDDAAWIDDAQLLIDCAYVNDVSQSECEALVALYDAAGGPGWTNYLGWMIDPNLCNWFGVTCDAGNSTVIGVDLDDNVLIGSIPAALADLGNLQTLSLAFNFLGGAIPVELGSLSSLVSLDLGFNQLSGTIPAALTGLTNLQSLSLAFNDLEGALPPGLEGLTELQTLWLAVNRLSGVIPAALGDLDKLQNLDLFSNEFTGGIPAELGSLTLLTGLDLANNRLSGPIPASLGSLVNAGYMYLQHNQLSGPIPKELGDLDGLGWLKLQSNKLTGPIPDELVGMTELAESGGLDIEYNGLYTDNAALDSFLNARQGSDWSLTQTVAPDNILAVPNGGESVTVSWDTIEFATGRDVLLHSRHRNRSAHQQSEPGRQRTRRRKHGGHGVPQ